MTRQDKALIAATIVAVVGLGFASCAVYGNDADSSPQPTPKLDVPRTAPSAATRVLQRLPLPALTGHLSPSQGVTLRRFTPAEGTDGLQTAAASSSAATSPRQTARPTPPVVQSGAAGSRLGKPAPAAPTSPTATQWAKLRWCESRGQYGIDTGNGYYGAYQFDLQAWRGIGMSGRPDLAAPAMQDAAARKLYALRGARPWPVCGRWLS